MSPVDGPLIVYQRGIGLVGYLVVTEDGCRDTAAVGNLQTRCPGLVTDGGGLRAGTRPPEPKFKKNLCAMVLIQRHLGRIQHINMAHGSTKIVNLCLINSESTSLRLYILSPKILLPCPLGVSPYAGTCFRYCYLWQPGDYPK